MFLIVYQNINLRCEQSRQPCDISAKNRCVCLRKLCKRINSRRESIMQIVLSVEMRSKKIAFQKIAKEKNDV